MKNTNSSEGFLTPYSKFFSRDTQDELAKKQVTPPRSCPWREEVQDKFDEIEECPVFRPSLKEFQTKSFQ
jgi:hypothetical protein